MNQEIDTLLPLKLNIDNASYTTVKDLDNALKWGQRQTSVDEFLRFSRKCGIDGT